VFQILHERLDPVQAGHIKSHVPKEFQDSWQLGPVEPLERAVGTGIKSRNRMNSWRPCKKGPSWARQARRSTRSGPSLRPCRSSCRERISRILPRSFPNRSGGSGSRHRSSGHGKCGPKPAGHQYNERLLGFSEVQPAQGKEEGKR
jgi:hypothetical protein